MMRGYYYGNGYGGMMGGYGWIAALLMWIFFALVILGIAALVIWAFRSASRHGHTHGGQPYGGQGGWDTTGGVITRDQSQQQYGQDYSQQQYGQSQSGQPQYGQQQAPQGGDDAVTIARRRFANGEITREEYEEMMRVLGA